jgi:TPP-dependent pyruvate/acetoin dehydrogenase alpha subunit
VLRNHMEGAGLASAADFKQLEREVTETVEAALRFAEESPFPAPGALHEDIVVE